MQGKISNISFSSTPGNVRGGQVVQRYSVNFQCQGVLLTWIIVGQGPIALAVGAGGGGGGLDIFFSSLSSLFSFSLSGRWPDIELKYCSKGPLNPKQPTNQPSRESNTKAKSSDSLCLS